MTPYRLEVCEERLEKLADSIFSKQVTYNMKMEAAISTETTVIIYGTTKI
jgi:hypothetical protein